MTITRLSIFPLPGALLFPGMHLPLHIFEPRYRAMVNDSLARDRRIAMIQPKGGGDKPPLFEIGCVGRIADVEAMEDGRFNVVLEGLSRFRILRELEVTTLFRQVEAELIADPVDETLSMGARAALAALPRCRAMPSTGKRSRGSMTKTWSTASPRSPPSTPPQNRRCWKPTPSPTAPS